MPVNNRTAVIPTLIVALEKSTLARKEAARSLGEMGPAALPAAEALKNALKKDEPDALRLEAAIALVKVGSPCREAVPPLLAQVIGEQGGKEKEYCRELDREAAVMLALCGGLAGDALPELQPLLGSRRPLTPRQVCIGLAVAGIQERLDAGAAQLGQIAETAEETTRAGNWEQQTAMYLLSLLGQRMAPAIPNLARIFRRAEPGSVDRLLVVEVLRNVGARHPTAVEILKEGAKDGDSGIRHMSERGLQSLGLP